MGEDGSGRAGQGSVAARVRPAFRPASRSRARILLGTLLSLLAIGTILLVFSTADKRVPVLQFVRDVPAGAQLVSDDVRSVELSADPSLEVVPAGEVDTVVGQYLKVRMVAGVLLARPVLQGAPLVAPGASVVAIVVPAGALPVGLRERSHVQLVFPVDATGEAAAAAPAPVEGRVIGLPGEPDPVSGELSVSIEVEATAAATVAGASSVRVVLLDPGTDAAATPTQGSVP